MPAQPVHHDRLARDRALRERETVLASILESRRHLRQIHHDLHDTVMMSRKSIAQSMELLTEANKALVRR